MLAEIASASGSAARHRRAKQKRRQRYRIHYNWFMDSRSSAMRLFLFLTLSWCICDAQSVSFGVIGGGQPVDSVSSPAVDKSERYTIGPMVDFGLPFGMGFEVDALY